MEALEIMHRSLPERRLTQGVDHVESCHLPLCSPTEGNDRREGWSPHLLLRPLPPELPEGAATGTGIGPLAKMRVLAVAGGVAGHVGAKLAS